MYNYFKAVCSKGIGRSNQNRGKLDSDFGYTLSLNWSALTQPFPLAFTKRLLVKPAISLYN